MSLKPPPIGPVPELTAYVAHAAFPDGNPYLSVRDALGTFYDDERFAGLFPDRGQPAEAPWRLALVTVLQFAEGLPDRQAADAVRGRIDWKYALGLELTDPGFDFSVLCEFRARLLAGGAERLLLEAMLETCKGHGLVKARGRQRTDSTHVLAAIRTLNRLELVGETLRAALNSLATVAPNGCDRGPRRSGSIAIPRGSRSRACPRARRPATPTARPSAPTASGCSRPSTARPRRGGWARCRPWRSCGGSGWPSSTSRRAGCAGGGRRPAAGGAADRLAVRPRGDLRQQAEHDLDRLQGPPRRDVRRRPSLPDHERGDHPGVGEWPPTWTRQRRSMDFLTDGGRRVERTLDLRSPPLPNPRRTFTREFKTEAVRRVTEQGHSPAEVGRGLQIGESTLRGWKRAIAAEGEQAFPGKGHAPALEEELRRLGAEVKRLTMEREILKEATASLARESS